MEIEASSNSQSDALIRASENSSEQNTIYSSYIEAARAPSNDNISVEKSVLKSELIMTTSTIDTLILIDESMEKMRFFASRFVANIAIYLNEFSISCDMSRYHLKLIEKSRKETVKKAEENKLGSRCFSGKAIEGVGKEKEENNGHNDAIVWAIRGLAFAGVGE